MIAWLELQRRQHTVYILTEVEVTRARSDVRAYRARTGKSLSLTAFIMAWFAQAIGEQALVQIAARG